MGDIPDNHQSNKLSKAHWPLENVWLGVSVEDESTVHRVATLREIPATHTWISYEPALNSINFSPYMRTTRKPGTEIGDLDPSNFLYGVDLIVGGGQSGKDAIPAHPKWFQETAYQCYNNGATYYHKQNGVWIDKEALGRGPRNDERWGTLDINGNWFESTTPWNGHTGNDSETDEVIMIMVGVKKAGHLLNGVAYREMPSVAQVADACHELGIAMKEYVEINNDQKDGATGG